MMEDKILGHLTYNVGWCKTAVINLWQNEQAIKAYKEGKQFV